jgi:hypothetical protein
MLGAALPEYYQDSNQFPASRARAGRNPNSKIYRWFIIVVEKFYACNSDMSSQGHSEAKSASVPTVSQDVTLVQIRRARWPALKLSRCSAGSVFCTASGRERQINSKKKL